MLAERYFWLKLLKDKILCLYSVSLNSLQAFSISCQCGKSCEKPSWTRKLSTVTQTNETPLAGLAALESR